jgi:hypothetical protein
MDEQDRRDRRDDVHDRKRVATKRDTNERVDDEPRRYAPATRDEQLTRREREERWPVG